MDLDHIDLPYFIFPTFITLPITKSKLIDAEKVYVVGHSSGAVAIMRLCEEIEVDIEAAFVVSACATHLDDAGEKAAGYYPEQPDGSTRPWRFDLIRKKCKRLVYISSKVPAINYVSCEGFRV